MSPRAASILFGARELKDTYELRNRLEIAGVRVTTAATTREVLERLREETPDLVVLDRSLDSVGIATLIRALRAFVPAPDVLLLAEEKLADVESVRRVLDLLHYAPKPPDEEALYDLILNRLRERHLSVALPLREAPMVLCVDDDALHLSSLTRVLSSHGYRVHTADSAHRALESFSDVQPDVAIVDIMMPGTGGLELAERIRHRSGGRVPVVLLTALNTPASQTAAREKGASRYLTKPCSNKEVVAAVESVLAEADR
jgi:CheY-like chemotaxis protein